MARAEAYVHAKFHLDPSNRLATIHQRYRQDMADRTDRQRSDSIGRTILQTVAQKRQFFNTFFLANSDKTYRRKSSQIRVSVDIMTSVVIVFERAERPTERPFTPSCQNHGLYNATTMTCQCDDFYSGSNCQFEGSSVRPSRRL